MQASNTSIACAPKSSDVPIDEKQPRTDAKAAEAMWIYYRDHKDLLLIDIKEYRDGILAKLVAAKCLRHMPVQP